MKDSLKFDKGRGTYYAHLKTSYAVYTKSLGVNEARAERDYPEAVAHLTVLAETGQKQADAEIIHAIRTLRRDYGARPILAGSPWWWR
jgi:hypothetical protein